MGQSKTIKPGDGFDKMNSTITDEQFAQLREIQRQEAERLKERLLPIPYYARAYAEDPTLFVRLCRSYRLNFLDHLRGSDTPSKTNSPENENP